MCKYKYYWGDWRWVGTFTSIVSNPPWLGSNQKYSFPMAGQWPAWEELVVSVTASKQTHIWHMPQQGPIYLPATPRYISRTALDLWLKSDLWPSKASPQRAVAPTLSTCTKSSWNENNCLRASANICFHACCLKQRLITTAPFFNIFFCLRQLSSVLISGA